MIALKAKDGVTMFLLQFNTIPIGNCNVTMIKKSVAIIQNVRNWYSWKMVIFF